MAPKFFISAGESSGDRYGAALVRAIRAREPNAQFVGLGGSRMAEAGVELVRDVLAHAVMGIVSVVRNMRTLYSIYRDAVAAMLALGYKRSAAERAVERSTKRLGPDATLENIIRESLQQV